MLSSPSLRPLELREIFDRAFELYRCSAALLLPVSFTIQAAAFGASLVLGGGSGLALDPDLSDASAARLLELIGLALGNGAIQILFSSFSAALLIATLDRAFWARPILLRHAFLAWRQRGLILLLTLAIIGSLLALCLFSLPAAALWLGSPPWSWLVALGGLVLGGAAALALGLRWALAPMAVLLEGRGPLASLGRSAELLGPVLSRGPILENAWLRLLVLTAGPFLLQVAIAFVAGTLSWFFGGRSWNGGGTAAPFASAVTAALLQPFVWALLLLHFYDRRMRREGFDLEIRARSLLEELTS